MSNIVKQLLKDIPQQQQKSYQSYLHLHLKLLLTTINKAKVQDLTPVLLRKNTCIDTCYKTHLSSSSLPPQLPQTIQQIRECKRRCGQQKKAVKKYLDDINYYSLLKIQRCSKGCYGDQRDPGYNQCMWKCYNRLDRRYKQYWVEQRNLVEDKFRK